jgi:hypothetical protein
MANALEETGHQSVRFTVYEDLGHNSYTRVYAGEDLYQWLLGQRLPRERDDERTAVPGGAETER